MRFRDPIINRKIIISEDVYGKFCIDVNRQALYPNGIPTD